MAWDQRFELNKYILIKNLKVNNYKNNSIICNN